MRSDQEIASVSWNRGQIVDPKAAAKAQAHLGNQNSPPGGLPHPRPRHVSKLRGCELVKLRVADVHLSDSVRLRTTIVQQKTGRPVPFELTDPTREALANG